MTLSVALMLVMAACLTAPPPKPPEGPPVIWSVGMLVRLEGTGRRDAVPVVDRVAVGGAAAQAGIAVDESLWAIDGKDTAGWSIGEIVPELRGPVGSTLVLRVGATRDAARDVVVTRALMPPDMVQCLSGDCQAGSGVGVDMWGQRYEGTFLNGRFHGVGKLVDSGGRSYEGNLVSGSPHGRGVMLTPAGDRIEGAFDMGAATGIMKVTRANGDVYDGEVADHGVNGRGRYTAKGGADVWVGRFVGGKLVEGLWTHRPEGGDGRSCDRGVVEGTTGPTGTITYPKGDKKKRTSFEGPFGDDCVANGHGFMHYRGKTRRLEGEFAADEAKPGGRWVD